MPDHGKTPYDSDVLPPVEATSMVNHLWLYTEHALSYAELCSNLRQYAKDEGPEWEFAEELADLIEDELTNAELSLTGADALFPALVLMLHGIRALKNKKHKTVVEKLVKAV